MKPFEIENMASGGFALVLEPKANWEDFSKFSKKWIERLGAEVTHAPVKTIDECIVEVQIGGGSFWITYDDNQSSIQLEPKDNRYNDIVLTLQKELRATLNKSLE